MKTGALKGKKVLYLDFDGVLHHYWVQAGRGRPAEPILDEYGYTLFEYEPVLVELIKPTDVLIVLSTSWANLQYHSTAWAKKWLHQELQDRIVGRTADVWMAPRKFRALPRGHQVMLHANQFKPDRWFALDDDIRGFEACPHNFVRTNPVSGLIPVKHRIKEIFDNWSNV